MTIKHPEALEAAAQQLYEHSFDPSESDNAAWDELDDETRDSWIGGAKIAIAAYESAVPLPDDDAEIAGFVKELRRLAKGPDDAYTYAADFLEAQSATIAQQAGRIKALEQELNRG